MLPPNILRHIARYCDACTRETLSLAVNMAFPPERLPVRRMASLSIPSIRYDARSNNYYVYYARRCHNLHIKITRYCSWTAYDYSFEKYDEDILLYVSQYWTDCQRNVVVQHPTFCKNINRECGCVLCTKHLQTSDKHLIAEINEQCHEWHKLKATRCPRRFVSFQDDVVQRAEFVHFN